MILKKNMLLKSSANRKRIRSFHIWTHFNLFLVRVTVIGGELFFFREGTLMNKYVSGNKFIFFLAKEKRILSVFVVFTCSCNIKGTL